MKTKKLWSISIVVTVLLALVTVGTVLGQEPEPGGDIGAQAAAGTGFTYQGRLTDGGSPANGEYDFRFRLYDAVSSGSQVGSTNNRDDVTVTEGLFTVQLDFGSGAFNGDARYLEITVDCGAGATLLTPRHPLTAAPYALYSQRTPWSGITAMPAGFATGVTPMLFGLVIILFLILEPRGLAHRWTLFKAAYRLWPFSY